MKKSINIEFTVPLDEKSITFEKWLPEGEEFILIRGKGNILSKIVIDKTCVNSLGKVDDEKIKKWGNVQVGKLYVYVEVKEISEELISFIYDERDLNMGVHHGISPESDHYKELKNQYDVLDEKVLREVVDICNRLIVFAQVNKEQFWLNKINFDKKNLFSMNRKFNARVKSESYDWFR